MTKILKTSGRWENFSKKKLCRSLKRAGASDQTCEEIYREIAPNVDDDTSTRDIFKMAFRELNSRSHRFAATYSLKKALFDLGPSGFPFEQFVARLYEAQGYEVKTNYTAKGGCVNHEIDVVATKGKERILVECKFHNQMGKVSDLKTSLYVYARSLDVYDSERFTDFALYTNTSFSEEAIKYGECVGLKLVGWNYPPDRSLASLISSTHLHPITSLTSLRRLDQKFLIESGYLTCKQVFENQSILKKLRKSNEHKVLKEIKYLLNSSIQDQSLHGPFKDKYRKNKSVKDL